MSIFNFFRKHTNQTTQSNSSDTSMVLGEQKTTNNTSSKKNTIGIDIPTDIASLLWFADGPYKNYTPSEKNYDSYEINGYFIRISTYGSEEPSLIYLNMPFRKPQYEHDVPRPPYYPSYKELTSEQKWMYWQFLSNPYTGAHDIGYVFIFYYGVERFLFTDKANTAFEVILKLRDCYPNQSFQSYSSTAIILYSIVKRDISMATKFLDSLDKRYEMTIPANLFILLKHSLALPLTAFELMHYAKAFSFDNQRYIKNNPEMFLGFLQEEIKNRYQSDCIMLSNFFVDADIKKIPSTEIPLFANISIRDKIVKIPVLTAYKPFSVEMHDLLVNAHERTKKYLAELRKTTKKETCTKVAKL